MTFAIIGAGRMGRWFAQFFLKEGESVIVADRDKKVLAKVAEDLKVETASNVEAVRDSDKILISVPLEDLESVVKDIQPHVRPEQAVMDICSVKRVPVEIMHRHFKKGTILGTHPVFGPGASSIVNQNFVLTPINRKERLFAQDFKSWLEKRGAKVSVMSPRKHDELMSVVLGFPHLLGLAVCETLLDCKDFRELEMVSGPSYRMLLTFAEAVASEQTGFYTSLQMNLPGKGRIESLFLEKTHEWLNLVKQKDAEAFADRMGPLKMKLRKLGSDPTAAYEAMQKLTQMPRK
jgi:prephenate dehydrogenase